VFGRDLSLLGGKAERLRTDTQDSGCLGRVQPPFRFPRFGVMNRDPVVASQRRHPLAGPAVAVSGAKIVAIEHACDQVVAADAHQHAHGLDNVLRGAVAVSPPAAP